MNNMYSLKAYGTIGNRSLQHLGKAKRYLPTTTPQPKGCLWGHSLKYIRIGHGAAVICHTVDGDVLLPYKTCISTLPMPVILDVAMRSDPDGNSEWEQHRGDDAALKAEPITVLRGKLLPEIKCSVNQTIYFPESELNTYRATLEKTDIIIESVEELEDEEITKVLNAFGLARSMTIGKWRQNIQPYGKIVEIGDDLRRSIIYQLTDKYNIYSLGRFATWRPLRADQLVKDVHKVERMVRQSEQRNRYERRLQC
jgi:hypothetical protein